MNVSSLLVRVPPSYLAERKYILRVLLEEFLGIPFQIEVADGSKATLFTLKNFDSSIRVPDMFFSIPSEHWLQEGSLPKTPLDVIHAEDVASLRTFAVEKVFSDGGLPVLYGHRSPNGSFITRQDNSIELGIDIIGGAFFLLTRYEEIANPARDEFERFPGSASVAYQEGFLERPLVNEYLEILWAAMKSCWPHLERKPREFSIALTHDVDRPWTVAKRSAYFVLRSGLADLIRRKDPGLLLRRALAYFRTTNDSKNADPANTFDFIMDLSDKYGLKSAFYFLTDRLDERDANYLLSDPWIESLLRKIRERGHEVGLHTSFQTFLDSPQTQKETQILRSALMQLGLEQEVIGGRQHYLRWRNPTTWQNWEDAGLRYDSTLYFADNAGFRCGVCYEFPVFNLLTRQPLKLRERPLILMEQTILNAGTGHEIQDTVVRLAKECKRFHGIFTILWHNDHLQSRREKQIYSNVLAALVNVAEPNRDTGEN